MKIYTAFTYEVDDIELAVSEILEQIKQEANLLKNSVGIVHCNPDFIETGVMKAVCQALPFQTVGTTTIGSAVGDKVSEMILTLMVLTGDDVSFAVGLTEPLISPDIEILRTAYETAVTTLTGSPSLILAFFPPTMAKAGIGGDFIPNSLPIISGNVPIFGTLAISNVTDYADARIFCNGEIYLDRFAFILIQGNVKPRFYRATISDEKVLKDKGIITKSQNTYLYTVNDVPVLDYLRKVLGITIGTNDPSVLSMIPLILDSNDGSTPIIRIIIDFTPDGVAICTGEFPQNAKLSVGRFDRNVVLETTAQTLKTILANETQINGILMYSCAARYWTLGFDPLIEMEIVRDALFETKISYEISYSGGEFCPVYAPNGDMTNQLHNYTFIACVF